MKVSLRNRRWVIAALLPLLAFWAYQTVDARLLERDCRSAAERKAHEVASRMSEKRLSVADTQVRAWRTIPVIGVPSAKVTVTLSYQTPTGSALTTPFDYFLTRRGGQWQEMPPHCNTDHGSGGESDCH